MIGILITDVERRIRGCGSRGDIMMTFGSFRLNIVYALAVLSIVLWLTPVTFSHGDGAHDKTPAVDTLLVPADADSTAAFTVAEFQLALDSIYTGIAGTYHGIHRILKNSCYDCHSNQTNYPWYYIIPGISGMIDHDIEEGMEHLDMSDGFPFGGHASQYEQLRGIKKEIEKDAMPLKYYRWVHWGAAIEGVRRDSLFEWIDSSMNRIETVHERYSMPLHNE